MERCGTKGLDKLKQNVIKGKLLCLLIGILRNRQQRLVLNGQFSSWTNVNSLNFGIFIFYVNGYPNVLQSNQKIFADEIFCRTTYHHKHYLLAEKKLPNQIHHWTLMTISFTRFNPKALCFAFRFRIKFGWICLMHLK